MAHLRRINSANDSGFANLMENLPWDTRNKKANEEHRKSESITIKREDGEDFFRQASKILESLK